MPKGLFSWVCPDSVKLTININHNQSIFVEVSPWEPNQMASCFGASLFTIRQEFKGIWFRTLSKSKFQRKRGKKTNLSNL